MSHHKPSSGSNPRRKAYFKPKSSEGHSGHSSWHREARSSSHSQSARNDHSAAENRRKSFHSFGNKDRFEEEAQPKSYAQSRSRPFSEPRPFSSKPPRPQGRQTQSPRQTGPRDMGPRRPFGDAGEYSSEQPKPGGAFATKEGFARATPAKSYDRFKTKNPDAQVGSDHPSSQMLDDEVKVYGLHAILSLFNKRPQDIIRLYCLESMIPRIPDLLKHCVESKKAYHVVTAEELKRITDSIHHEGICVLTKKQPTLSFEELLVRLKTQRGSQALIYLEGVENPHNIGSLLRICAHFGVRYLLTDQKELSDIPSATYRVAKGGAEEVFFVPLSEPLKKLKMLKEAGFSLLSSSGYAKNSLYEKALPEKTLFIFGSETDGIADSFLKLSSDILSVPGSGGVESLNVSITSALFLGEFWRQHHKTPHMPAE